MPSPLPAQQIDGASWSTNPVTKTVDIPVLAGDAIVLAAIGADSGITFPNLPTNNGAALVWTQLATQGQSAWSRLTVWKAVADSNRTITVSVTSGGSTQQWNLSAHTWRNAVVGLAVGVLDQTASFTVGINTTQDNSAVDLFYVDWDAVLGARTYVTATAGPFTEKTGAATADISGQYSVRTGYHADAGVQGLKTVGTSAPAGQKATIIAVEIKGVAAGDTTPPTVNLTSGATQRMSDEPGKDSYAYSFTVSEACQAWKVKLVANSGDDNTTGTLIESGGAVAAGGTVSGSITYAELVAAGVGAEGNKILKFFAQDAAGNWSN